MSVRVVAEEGSAEADALLIGHRLAAPDLLVAECASVLWQKVRRSEITHTEAEVCARVLEQADIQLMPMRHLMQATTEMAIRISHPAYDCIYLSLAAAHDWTFVTADERFVRKVRHLPPIRQWPVVMTLAEAAARL